MNRGSGFIWLVPAGCRLAGAGPGWCADYEVFVWTKSSLVESSTEGHGLASMGLIRGVGPAGSPARHESRAGGNHHHIVCRRCGTAADVACAAGPAPCLEPAASAGFAIDGAQVTFWGLCPRCQASPGDPGAGGGPAPALPATTHHAGKDHHE